MPLEVKEHQKIDQRGLMVLSRANETDTGSSGILIMLAGQPDMDGKYTIFGRLNNESMPVRTGPHSP